MAAHQPWREKRTRSNHSELAQRSPDDNCLPVVLLESRSPGAGGVGDKTAHLGASRGHLTVGGGAALTRGARPLSPAPLLCLQSGHPHPAAQLLLMSWVPWSVLPPREDGKMFNTRTCRMQPTLIHVLQRLCLCAC